MAANRDDKGRTVCGKCLRTMESPVCQCQRESPMGWTARKILLAKLSALILSGHNVSIKSAVDDARLILEEVDL